MSARSPSRALRVYARRKNDSSNLQKTLTIFPRPSELVLGSPHCLLLLVVVHWLGKAGHVRQLAERGAGSETAPRSGSGPDPGAASDPWPRAGMQASNPLPRRPYHLEERGITLASK